MRLLCGQLESGRHKLLIAFQLRIGFRSSEFAGLMHRQLKFRCRLFKVRVFFQQRLREISRAIG